MEDDKKKPTKKDNSNPSGMATHAKLISAAYCFPQSKRAYHNSLSSTVYGLYGRFHIGRQNNLDNVSERDMSSSSSGRL